MIGNIYSDYLLTAYITIPPF